MKRIILSFSFTIIAALSIAQSKYENAMLANKTKLDSAKTSEDYVTIAASFERVAEAEKKEWLPYYYAALSNILRGFTDKAAHKDELADKADALIAKAEAIDSKNSEIFLLKSMSATLHLIVDPMNRWQKYGGQGKEALETAKQYDANNPRIYYWEGQNLFGTPEQFGGGKAKAKPVFEKALQLFQRYKPASNLHPTWGQKTAEHMLTMCNS
jgi:hypothetical protein